MRHTKGHRNNRRSHFALSSPAISKDADGSNHLRHRVSPTTGKYKGRQVVNLEKKVAKKAKRNSQSK